MGNDKHAPDHAAAAGRWHFFFEDDSDEPTIVWVRPPARQRRTHQLGPPPVFVPLPCQRIFDDEEE